MTTKYLNKQQHRWHTNLLESAIRSGNHDKVIATVQATFAAWDADDYAYPDDWQRWERASRDAEHALAVAARPNVIDLDGRRTTRTGR